MPVKELCDFICLCEKNIKFTEKKYIEKLCKDII